MMLWDWIPSLKGFVALLAQATPDGFSSTNCSVWLCTPESTAIKQLGFFTPSLLFEDSTHSKGASPSFVTSDSINYLLNNNDTFVVATMKLQPPFETSYQVLMLDSSANYLMRFAIY